MKPFVCCAITFAFLNPTLICAQSGDQQRLEQLEHKFRFTPKDSPAPPEFVQKYVADNYVWNMPGGEMGRSDLLKNYPGITVYEVKISDMKIHPEGDVAIVNGHWWKREKDEDQKVREYKGIFQDIWEKKNGSWRLIASATSPFHVEVVASSDK